jgi:biotin synthase
MKCKHLCFIAGANSIFAGEKLLTTPNPGEDHDQLLVKKLGISFKSSQQEACSNE